MGFAATLAWSRLSNMIACQPPLRFEFVADDERVAERVPETSTDDTHATTDYARIEELLARCWNELDGIELNVKLTDMIRLLEFKHKLASGAEAEREFWRLINTIRHDELALFGDIVNPEKDPKCD